MTGFILLSDVWRSLFFSALYLLFCIEICILLSHFSHMHSFRRSAEVAAQLVVTTLIDAVLLCGHTASAHGQATGGALQALAGLPWGIWAALIAALSLWVVHSGIEFLRIYRRIISAVSVKNGTDNLPVGLCFYSPDGKPLLVNRRMDELCQDITGDGLLNASAFWDTLSKRHSVNPSDSPIWVDRNDGSAWVFSRSAVTVEGRELYQLIASDMTRLHEIEKSLREGNEEMQRFNERLRRHSANVDQLTREEEILAAKIKIHDELGQALLASKYYLTHYKPDIAAELSPEKLISMWEQDVALLRKEAHPVAAFDPMRELTDAAAAVGVNVMIFGAAPGDDREAMSLIFTAARVCLTNAVRHAAATSMTITFSRIGAIHLVTITNNGTPPEDTIIEGGGLSDLRQRVEDAGGTMQIFSHPEFKLTISIPSAGGNIE